MILMRHDSHKEQGCVRWKENTYPESLAKEQGTRTPGDGAGLGNNTNPESGTESYGVEKGASSQGEGTNRGYGPWMLVQPMRKSMAKARVGLTGNYTATGLVELARQRTGQGRMGKEIMEQRMGDDSGKGRFEGKSDNSDTSAETSRGKGDGKKNRARAVVGPGPAAAKDINQSGPSKIQSVIAGPAQEKGQFPYLARLGSRSQKAGMGAQKRADSDV